MHPAIGSATGGEKAGQVPRLQFYQHQSVGFGFPASQYCYRKGVAIRAYVRACARVCASACVRAFAYVLACIDTAVSWSRGCDAVP